MWGSLLHFQAGFPLTLSRVNGGLKRGSDLLLESKLEERIHKPRSPQNSETVRSAPPTDYLTTPSSPTSDSIPSFPYVNGPSAGNSGLPKDLPNPPNRHGQTLVHNGLGPLRILHATDQPLALRIGSCLAARLALALALALAYILHCPLRALISGDPYYNGSTAAFGNTTETKKNGLSPWIKCSIPILILVIIGAVVGSVVGSRKSFNSNTASNSGSGGANSRTAESSATSVKNSIGRFATGTNPMFVPVCPATTNTAVFGSPAFGASSNNALAWLTETFNPAFPQPTNVRPDHPRLIAPAHKGWNDTILGNATDYYNQPVKAYYIDGASGVLDITREVKMRIKAFAYVYCMANDTKWVDRAWKELQNVAGNGAQPIGTNGDNWYTKHFLNVAEFTNVFAIGYDWMYNAWTPTQREQIIWFMIARSHLRCRTGVNGNWNCVCNGGLTLGALAILELRPRPSSDGTWSEPASYWYFSTTSHDEMTSSLISATGSDYKLIAKDYNLTVLYHIHVTSMTSLFNYSDHGPNKFSTTANSMIFYGSHFDNARSTPLQRKCSNVAEPWPMLWYDPTVSGAFWDDMPLGHYFDKSVLRLNIGLNTPTTLARIPSVVQLVVSFPSFSFFGVSFLLLCLATDEFPIGSINLAPAWTSEGKPIGDSRPSRSMIAPGTAVVDEFTAIQDHFSEVSPLIMLQNYALYKTAPEGFWAQLKVRTTVELRP
ncbi:hypothetical protein FRC07_013669 [Ceratobasidium sp. 392]|nr:hypothetical protein FRC07_013669 [Ceratobasidium sp. 392]